MEKKFEFGLVLGRFHPLHKGHMEIIDLARKLCKKTLILIGSAGESGTVRNPFKLETRKKIIHRVYPHEDVIIGALEDLTNENDISFEWGKYILESVEKMYGVKPDLMLYGRDDSRKGWFSEEDQKIFSEMIVAKNQYKISGTKLREFLVKNEKKEWEQFVDEKIFNFYDELRNELLEIQAYQKLKKSY